MKSFAQFTLSHEKMNAIPSVSELKKLTVVDLKDWLRQNELPVGGNKKELIKRLCEYAGHDFSDADFSTKKASREREKICSDVRKAKMSFEDFVKLGQEIYDLTDEQIRSILSSSEKIRNLKPVKPELNVDLSDRDALIKLKKHELQSICEELCVPKSGKKEDLVERILNPEENKKKSRSRSNVRLELGEYESADELKDAGITVDMLKKCLRDAGYSVSAKKRADLVRYYLDPSIAPKKKNSSKKLLSEFEEGDPLPSSKEELDVYNMKGLKSILKHFGIETNNTKRAGIVEAILSFDPEEEDSSEESEPEEKPKKKSSKKSTKKKTPKRKVVDPVDLSDDEDVSEDSSEEKD